MRPLARSKPSHRGGLGSHPFNRRLAERSGDGLQNRLSGFDSRTYVHFSYEKEGIQ